MRSMFFAALIATTGAFMVSPVPLRAAAATRPANVAMSAVVDEVMDKLKGMTLLEASELVKAIEETFGVDVRDFCFATRISD